MDNEVASTIESELNLAFESNTFLPHLEEFRCCDKAGNCSDAYCAPGLCSTIMSQTKQVRPLRSAALYLDSDSIRQLGSFALLSDVSFKRYQLHADSARHLMTCLPSLTKLDILLSGPTDFTPLLEHLPHESLLELSLRQCESDQADYRAEFIHEELSVQDFAKLTQLTSLTIKFDSASELFDRDISCDLSTDLPINSWSSLVKLCINTAWLTVCQLTGLLQAAPALQEIEFSGIVSDYIEEPYYDHEDLNYPLVVAIVGHICKHVTSLSINALWGALDGTVFAAPAVEAAFARFPLQLDSFAQLRSLALHHFHPQAVHLLFSKIAIQAPRLEYAGLSTSMALEVCMLRVLPNLRYFNLRQNFEGRSLLPLSDIFSSQYQPGLPIFGEHHAHFSEFLPSDDDDVDKTYRYHVFRKELDSEGRTGLDVFFSLLYSSLSAGHQTRLTLWDAGDYVTQIPPG